MKIIRAKTIDLADSGVYVKLSNMEALLLRNLCANVSVQQGPEVLKECAMGIRQGFASMYVHHNPPLCKQNYKFMDSAEFNMSQTLTQLGDF